MGENIWIYIYISWSTSHLPSGMHYRFIGGTYLYKGCVFDFRWYSCSSLGSWKFPHREFVFRMGDIQNVTIDNWIFVCQSVRQTHDRPNQFGISWGVFDGMMAGVLTSVLFEKPILREWSRLTPRCERSLLEKRSLKLFLEISRYCMICPWHVWYGNCLQEHM